MTTDEPADQILFTLAVVLLVTGSLLSAVPAAAEESPGSSVTTRAETVVRSDLRQVGQPPDRRQGTSADQPAAPVISRPSARQVSIRDEPALGSADAPVTVVEFMDYECPFCRKFARETYSRLRAKYIEPGMVRWVSRDLPLPFHGRARAAAVAAQCAAEQGRFWEMHDVLLRQESRLTEDALRSHADKFGLDAGQFGECLASDRHIAGIDRDVAAALALGINGTPGFLVGRADGDVVRGQVLVGAKDYAEFEKAITFFLSR